MHTDGETDKGRNFNERSAGCEFANSTQKRVYGYFIFV
jgi:hypothetical protein